LTMLALVAATCALAVLPARWLMVVLPQSGVLALADAQGSIWSGSATLALGRPELRRSVPEPVRWTFGVSGGPHWIVTHPALGGPLRLAPTRRGVQIPGQALRLPATALSTLHAALGALQPGGELTLRWSEQTLGFGATAAGAALLDVRWNAASAALTRIQPMGSYRAQITTGEDGRVAVALSTVSGPLMLTAQGSWSAQDGLRLQGSARADDKATPDVQVGLQDFLHALGPRQGDRHTFRFR